MVAQPDNRRRIGIRELRDHLSEVIGEVRDDDLAVDVTLHGQVVAELRPKHSNSRIARKGVPPGVASMEERRRWADDLDDGGILVPPLVDPNDRKEFEERLDRLAREVTKRWPKGLSAVDAIREDRDAE